mgnify:CR=1 FL=1
MLNNACKYTQSTPLTACVSGVLCNMRTPPPKYDETDKKSPPLTWEACKTKSITL